MTSANNAPITTIKTGVEKLNLGKEEFKSSFTYTRKRAPDTVAENGNVVRGVLEESFSMDISGFTDAKEVLVQTVEKTVTGILTNEKMSEEEFDQVMGRLEKIRNFAISTGRKISDAVQEAKADIQAENFKSMERAREFRKADLAARLEEVVVAEAKGFDLKDTVYDVHGGFTSVSWERRKPAASA